MIQQNISRINWKAKLDISHRDYTLFTILYSISISKTLAKKVSLKKFLKENLLTGNFLKRPRIFQGFSAKIVRRRCWIYHIRTIHISWGFGIAFLSWKHRQRRLFALIIFEINASLVHWINSTFPTVSLSTSSCTGLVSFVQLIPKHFAKISIWLLIMFLKYMPIC